MCVWVGGGMREDVIYVFIYRFINHTMNMRMELLIYVCAAFRCYCKICNKVLEGFLHSSRRKLTQYIVLVSFGCLF